MRGKPGMKGRNGSSAGCSIGIATVVAALVLGGCGEMSSDGEEDPAETIRSAISPPNDPDFKKQWSLNNTGQDVVINDDQDVQAGRNNVDMRLLKGWDTTQGSSSVIVAVIEQLDADLDHPDLVATRWVNPGEIPGNNVDDDHNGLRDDVFGWDFTDKEADVSDDLDDSIHATHISGIIGAQKGNQRGISGVAPGIRVMHLRAAANDAPAINAAIDYARNKGARIVNLSQGGGPAYNIPAVRDKIAATSSMLFVCSAGNNAISSFNYPSSYPAANILAVANADNLGNLARSSNFGERHVDIAAPGLGVFSTEPGDSYGWANGTSQAAANASGVAALLLSSEPSLTPTQVVARLETTGMRVPLFNRLMQAPAIVDAEAALANALDVNLVATSVPGRITLTWDPIPGATRYQVERDGTQVDNQLNRTFVHSNLVVDSLHIYRVRAHVNSTYGKWSYRVLKAASNPPVVETLAHPLEPNRGPDGRYLLGVTESKTVGKANSRLIRLHFTRIALSDVDSVTLNFGPGYSGGTALLPGAFWTQWFPGPEVTVTLNSNEAGNDFGYRVDQIEYILQ